MTTNTTITLPAAALMNPAIEAVRAGGEYAALAGVEKALASEKPETLADAAVSLLLARELAHRAGDDGESDKTRAEALADASRLIDAALGVVAGASGIDLDDYGADFYGINQPRN